MNQMLDEVDSKSSERVGRVMTVLGLVEPTELGRVLAHEHLFIDLYRVYQPHRDMKLSDPDLIRVELERFREIGGGTVVDLTTPDLGRNPTSLREISHTTGLHVVMGSGHYRKPFYGVEIDRLPTRQIQDAMVRDVLEGESGVLPGVIGEIGTDESFIAAVEERVHRASARAARKTGLSVVTHSLGSDVGLAQLDLMTEEGLSPDRVAIGHADTFPHWQYHEELLGQGAYLIYDTIRGLNDYETRRTARLILRAVEAGFENRILLSHDVCATGHLSNYGGRGFTYVHGEFLGMLAAEGLSKVVLEKLAGRNAQRFLTIRSLPDLD